MESQEDEKFLKFICIGSEKTGKSSLVKRFTCNSFELDYRPTIGVEFITKILNHNSTNYKLQIWDSAGQQRFMGLLNSYLKGSHCVFILYNPSDRASFDKLADWVDRVKTNPQANTKIVVVENEFEDEVRLVSKKEAIEKVIPFEVPLISVNAKTGTGVENLFLNSISYAEGNEVKWGDFEEYKTSEIKDNNAPIPVTENLPVDPSENLEYDHLFKFLLIGDGKTGKSCINSVFSDGTFTEDYLETIGVDFKIRTIQVGNKIVKLQVWDSAGQERFKTMTLSYYNGSSCVFITYSSGNRQSFENVANWFIEAEHFCSDQTRIALIENEFENTERQVAEHEGQELANKFKLEFFRVNAKKGNGIEIPFVKMSEILISPCDLIRSTYRVIAKELVAIKKEKEMKIQEEEKEKANSLKGEVDI